MDEISKELQKKVRYYSRKEYNRVHTGSPQVTEADQLRQKIKSYSNYDEIKRELEIMKVSQITTVWNLLSTCFPVC